MQNREFAGLQFIKTQKKIARAVTKRKEKIDDYFTYDMLNRDIVIKSGSRGIPEPPDTVKDSVMWYLNKERNCILKHPEKKQLSFEEIEKRCLRMKHSRRRLSYDSLFRLESDIPLNYWSQRDLG
ncbi:MAG: hypothetical protein QXO75_11055 [Nitrososphaerota archaeon]